MTEEKQLTFHERIVKVQSELRAPKGQYNTFGKYKYRSCEDIVESAKPILAKYHLYLNLSDEIVLIGDRYYVKATAVIGDEKEEITSTAYAREPNDKKGMDESQITGTASSYARKYALNGLLAIDDNKDADSELVEEESIKSPQLDDGLLEQCADLNIQLNKVAIYLKKSVGELTNDDLKKCIAQKQGRKAN